MIANKHISKIIIAITAVAVVLCILAAVFYDDLSAVLGGTGVNMEYETRLFDTDEIISVDIQMDEDEWEKMLKNATSEEYYVCDVVVNGLKVNNVAIRPKGNTSLSSIAMDPDTDRYSMKLEFDHFVDGQTCYGLDKLILNNNYADATNMKEAIIYDMYQYIGADASLYNYAKVSVNGEYWGVYLALEAVEESFMLRNFGTQDGELYKPDSMEMGGGNKSDSSSSDKGGAGFGGITPPSGGDKKTDPSESGSDSSDSGRPSFGGFSGGNMPDMSNIDPNNIPDMSTIDPNNLPDMGSFDSSNMPDMSNFDPNNMPDMGNFDPGNIPDNSGSGSASDGGDSGAGDKAPSGMGGFSRGGGGANLNYTDDLDSYSTIWEGEITGTSDADHRRVVTALKNNSEGNNLEKYLDVDNLLKYMAVHTFAVNMDSLSGSMAHNYYLYEYKGQLNIFPWDYNLSFGGMMGGANGASSVINDAIDTPFAGTEFFDSLLENEEYLAKYHEYLRQLVDEYVNGGRFDEVYDRIRSQIDSLVETDPIAFYSYDEYQTAVQMLYDTVKLRAESIEGQLDGTIPSTDAGQREDSSNLIDASGIDIEAMGQYDMGFGGRDDEEDNESSNSVTEKPTESATEDPTESATESVTEAPTEAATENPKDRAGTGAMLDMGDFDPNNMPDMGNMQPGNIPDMGGMQPGNMPDMGGMTPGNMPDMENFDPNNMPDMENFDPNNMPDPGSMTPGNMPDQGGFGQPGTSETQEETQPATEAEDNKKSTDDQTSKGGMRPSFSGMPGQSGGSLVKNLIIFGVCLIAMIAALFIVEAVKRKR